MKLFLTAMISLCAFQGFSQCNVTKTKVDDNTYRHSTTETFYRNEDLENGIQGVFFSVNVVQDRTADKIFLVDLVVTYCYSGSKTEIIPNQLTFQPGGHSNISLIAKEKSYQTYNLFRKMPNDVRSVECVFDLSSEVIRQILTEKSISTFFISDYTSSRKLVISPKYTLQLAEMLSCAIGQ